jgi:divalent metal cation (Fe/Co/Zn/Cd) transporter
VHHITESLEFPPKLIPLFRKARKYEWISLIYMISATFFSFLVMSNSQTMKTVWLEDMLGIIPPASFLIASKIIFWKPNKNFPYGYHKINGIAYLISSLALFILGVYLLLDGSYVLIMQEHPQVPYVTFHDHTIWLGYLMIIALLWSGIPSTFLGHIKTPLAYTLYDKILLADSKMNKASWMSGFASILGIIGIGLGFWWADALVGIIISIDIIKDGYTHLKQATLDLIDEIPKSIENNKETDPLILEVRAIVQKEKWVDSVKLRFRDDGHVFFGEVFIVPKSDTVPLEMVKKLHDKIKKHHWRLHDIVIMLTTHDA